MKGIKLSPLLMFALLLIILVISVIIGRWNTSEGFVAFQQNKPAGTDGMVWIPQYSGDSNKEGVYKLNDNMFFDFNNGNLIELDADEYKIAPTSNTGTTSETFKNYEGMENAPATATPETATPETATPETATPETATPETATPDPAKKHPDATVTGPAKTTSENAKKEVLNAKTAVDTARKSAEKANSENTINKNEEIMIAAAAVITDTSIVGTKATDVENATITLDAAIDAYNIAVTDENNSYKNTVEKAKVAVEQAMVLLKNALVNLTTLVNKLSQAITTVNANIKPDTTKDDSGVQVPGSGSATTVTPETKQDGTAGATYKHGIDTTGISINRVIITPRNGSSSKIYKTSTNATVAREESKLKSIVSSYATWSYTSQCKNTTPKFVIYMCWERKTYIIILDQENTTQPYSVFTFNKDDNGIIETFYEEKDILTVASPDIVGSAANTIVKEPLYEKKNIFMLSSKIGYDIQRGNVVVKPENADIRINDRNGNPHVIQNLKLTNEDTLLVGDKTDWRIVLNNKLAGIVILDGDNTIVCIFSNNIGKLELKNVKRFTPKGIYINGELHPNELTKSFEEKEEKDDSDVDDDEKDDSNYILKTQIVPPVCPTCPTCPDNVACTNCGGNGGSGTLKPDGKSILGGVVSGTTDVATGIVSGTTGLARDAVSGTTDLAKDAVSGSVGLATDAVTGSVGLARDAVSGSVGLLKDTASGVSGLFRPNPTRLGQANNMQMNQQGNAMQMNQQGSGMTYPQVTDSSTYFGALPNRTSNYMPITADFSAFSS